MNAPPRSRRGGFTSGDAAVLLSLLCLAVAILYPHYRRAAFEERVALAVADVDSLEASARAYLARVGDWPADAPAGMLPGELAAALPSADRPGRAGHVVDWNLWETVGRPTRPAQDTVPGEDADPDSLVAVTATEAPPGPRVAPIRNLAGITINSADEALLARLLQRYGTTRSFFREKSWTLILSGPG